MLFRTLPALGDKLLQAIIPLLLAGQALFLPVPAHANEYLQCVPFARQLSGVQIYGDAHLWWQKAAGRYARGNQPAPGAVLSLKSHGSSRLGHVAVVSRIIDDRNILISHANWSPINGRRGQIERNVAARDVSEANDWSRVRIWYAPIGKLGTTAYPANGFIYPKASNESSKRHWVAAAAKSKEGRSPNRQLFTKHLQSELADKARDEKLSTNEPVDLIGDLLDRTVR